MAKSIKVAQKFELWPVEKLVPYDRNPKIHSDEQVAGIARSIETYGFNAPILVRGETIVAGHGRLKAAQKLGMEKVPVVQLDHLTAMQARAYMIADNAWTERASWSLDLLTEEVMGLADDDTEFDPEILGLDDDMLKSILGIGDEAEFPDLDEGERSPYRQMTFILHESQHEIVSEAIELAQENGASSNVNENSNGNALAALAMAYLARKKG